MANVLYDEALDLAQLKISCRECGRSTPTMQVVFSYYRPGEWLAKYSAGQIGDSYWVINSLVKGRIRTEKGYDTHFSWQIPKEARFAFCNKCASPDKVLNQLENIIRQRNERKGIQQCRQINLRLRKIMQTNDLQALSQLRTEFEQVKTLQT